MKDSRLQKATGDDSARTRAVVETNRSFVVEASAGTGKTRTLLDRILHLVLEQGPGGTPVPLSRICAITFTEKAAGEMKLRLRQELEKRLLHAATPASHYGLAREALSDLETASISTFHSFAVSLLKERPVEAGLDPHFTALDDIRSELFFREIWEPWINRALSERYPVLEKALRNGFRLQNLLNLAIALRKDWLNIRDLECDRPPSEELYREAIKGHLQKGRQLLQMNTNANDRLAVCLEDALVWLEHPEDDGSGFQKPGNVGAAKNWSGGKETVQSAQQFLRTLFEFQQQYRELPKQKLLHEVVSWIKDDFMIGEWEKRKRGGGLLDFDDQLRLARDLLLQDKTVRKEFQQQYRTLLVDEFQDTDLIQWSIVLLLSSTDLDEKDPAKLKPESGRLFVVGDPKQSIYRFRNADIETYLGIVDPPRLKSFDLERLELTTNFRSVPSILRFVDAAFENAMKPAGETCLYQPGYLAFGGQGYRDAGSSAPAVYLLGDVNQEGDTKRRARETVETESTRIARLILEMSASENWKVHGSHGSKDENGAGWRAAQFGDVAVLLPVLTHAHVLEEKLRDHGIPYVLEGGKFYYARSEVSSAILLLHAIANPNDSVALYGSLRSIFFGLSDEDLLRARIEGLPLDYRKEVPHESPLCRPFEILRDLHSKRHERRASETFEVLLENTGAREVLAVRGFQSLANLNKLSRTLRAFQNDATFSQVVDLLDTMDEEELAESESRLMEERSNAVRIMSIHKSKGLDFPIVIAAALGLGTVSRTKDILVDRAEGKIFSIKAGSKDSGLISSRWQEFADEEKKRENAELVRLLYVALTRAQDHLILSTHTAAARKPEGSEKYVPNLDKTRLQPLDSFLAGCYSEGTDLAQIIDESALDAIIPGSAKTPGPKAKDWESIALKEYGELHALVEQTPYSANLRAAGKAADLHEAGEHYRDELMPEAAADRSLRLGVAFHEAMERVDLFASGGLNELAQEVATRHRLDPVSLRLLIAMMNETLSSELLSQAREALRDNRRVFREMTFARLLEPSTIEEGKIDLLFEGKDGWILVDYKTDWVSEEKEDVEAFFRGKYTPQIREYADALRARSIDVAASYLLVARTGMSVRVDRT